MTQIRIDAQKSRGHPESFGGSHNQVDAQSAHASASAVAHLTDEAQSLHGHGEPVGAARIPAESTYSSLRQDATTDGSTSNPEPSDGTNVYATPSRSPSRPEDALLLFHADILDDLECVRIANENRLRSLVSEEDWGKGVAGTLPEVALLQGLVEQLRAMEHGAELALCRVMRRHPLGAWVKRTVGVGEKQAARLLAAIGDPAARPNVAKLWAYCGLHVEHPGQTMRGSQSGIARVDVEHPGQHHYEAQTGTAGVAPRRRRGERANWNTKAKMRAYNVAESCIKQRTSPYRPIYDAGREKYADAVHAHDCPQCHAKAGEPLRDGHKHMRAMRLVMKAILRDLWVEARRTLPVSTPIREPFPREEDAS